MSADKVESPPPLPPSSPSLLPSAATPRQHRHRRHRHHLPTSPGTNNNNSDAVPSNSEDPHPLVADASHSSVASSRSRNRRSRRANAADRAGAAFDLLGDGARNGLTLCCDGVSVQRRHRDVIDDVSCLFHGGRVTAVVNCCGTHSSLALLAAVAGRIDCVAGNIVMNGVPVSASTYQAQMSFLEEKDALTDDGGATSDLLTELTVRENLEYASALRVANSAQAYSVEEVLQQLLLEPHQHARIRDCSLYVRRRVALGKELLLNPSVLLLDEPMGGLATHEAQQFLTILSKMAAPSAADAEARHIMREAMAASAGAEPPSSPPRVSIYTPRHSRMSAQASHGSGSGLSPWPPSASAPSSASAAAGHDSYDTQGGLNTGNSDGVAAPVFGAMLSGETQRVVILSMVQPRWALLQYVHDVVLLERSRCVFAGSVQEMLSVKLPKAATELRAAEVIGGTSSAAVGAAAASGVREGDAGGNYPYHDDDNNGMDPHMRSFTQVAMSSFAPVEDAPAGSYDAVAASIHRTRLNEEFVHGLYRLATTAAAAAAVAAAGGGMTLGNDFPEYGSFSDNNNNTNMDTSGTGARSPASVEQQSRSSLPVPVRADNNYATPISQLYVVQLGHTKAQVTAYMEVCAAGLLALPEASHQAPSGFVQLLHLFRFGFVELRHKWLGDLIALVLMLAIAAALAAVYGVQAGNSGMQNCAGILFFIVSLVVLQAVLSLDAQRREYAAYYRYSRSGYYSAWTYVLFRAVTALLWRFGLTSFIALVVFVLSNFGEPWREYRGVFEFGVIMAVLSFCCYFLVWFLCAWWPSDRVSRFLVFTFYTFNIVLAGLVLNLTTLPAVVQGVSFLSVMRLAYESSILTHFAAKSFGCDHGNNGTSSSNSSDDPSTGTLSSMLPCYTGAEYAAYMGFKAARRWPNVGILAELSAVLLLASWLLMALYHPRRRLKAIV